MAAARPHMPLQEARALLGLAGPVAPEALRRAFRAAAKATHPDRPGGSAERFRQVVEAYARLSEPDAARAAPSPQRERPSGPLLSIPISAAVLGGQILRTLPDGRRLKLSVPAGLRIGDRVRAGDLELTIDIEPEDGWRVQGHDVWITTPVAPFALAEGGRLAVETPLGRRIVWLTRKAARRGLIRVRGEGLPARGPHPKGDLILQLAVDEARPDSAARAARRRFAEAWAA